MLHTMPSRQKREWIRHLTAAKLANTQELTLLKTNQHSLFQYMIPVNAPPTATPGALLPRENQTTQNNKTGKPQTGGNTTQTRSHTSHKQQITHTPVMPRKEPTLRTELLLPEGQVRWRGVILRGGYSHIYLDNGETVKCSTNCPNIQVLIQKICTKGYLVDWNSNPSRLLSADNGRFNIFVGNYIVYMLTVYTDTPEERRRRPWLKHY